MLCILCMIATKALLVAMKRFPRLSSYIEMLQNPHETAIQPGLTTLLTMPRYLFRMALSHQTFRVPSLLSVAQLYDIPIKLVSEDPYRGVLVVDLEDETHVQYFLDRCIPITYVQDLNPLMTVPSPCYTLRAPHMRSCIKRWRPGWIGWTTT
jgi:hypothetical protein